MSINSLAPGADHALPTNRLPLLALIIASAISMVGNALTSVALPWFVLQTTGSAVLTGVAAFVNTVPLVIGAFLGGTLADRIGYKRASIFADVLSGGTVALIPLLWMLGVLNFWLLLPIIFLGALFDTPGSTARQALIPQLAARTGLRLEQVNATFSTIERGSLLIGPPLAGMLIAITGPSQVLLIDALTFVVSAALVGLFIPAITHERANQNDYVAEMQEGLHFILGNRLLRTVVLTATITNFLLSPIFSVIMPIYVNTTYGNATNLGVMIAAFGGGSVVGAVIYGAIGHRLSRRALFIGGFAGFGITLSLIALLPPLPVMLAVLVVSGLLGGPINPLVGTLLHERTPQAMLGRVFGTLVALATAAMPAAMLLAGVLVEAIGVRGTLICAATGSLLLGISLFFNAPLRMLDASPAPPSETA